MRSNFIILNLKFGKWILNKRKLVFVDNFLWMLYKIWNKFLIDFILGTEIPAETDIGKGLILAHGGKGVVIHHHAKIGDNVTVYHQVTIGGHGLGNFDEAYKEANKHKAVSAPVIGNNVTIFTGAKIIGPVTIGDGAIIGANAVVIKDVPAKATAVGVPARNIIK